MKFKKLLSIILAEIIALGMGVVVFAENVNTDLEEYIVIHNADELNLIRENLNGKYILENHIDLSSCSLWNPIGTKEKPFTGIINGNGYSISNMNSHNGLFGYINGAEINDLGLVNIDISCSTIAKVAGGFSNFAENSTISNCFVDGLITASTGSSSVALACEYTSGTFVGCAKNSAFRNCFSLANNRLDYEKTPIANMGGLVGFSENTQYSCCYSVGEIYAEKPIGNNSSSDNIIIGNLVGYDNGNSKFNYCYDLKNKAFAVGNCKDSIDGITSLTSEEMGRSSSFSGFDFLNTWYMSKTNIPRLLIEKPFFKTTINMKYKEKTSPTIYGNLNISEWQSTNPDAAIISGNEIEAVGKGDTTINIITQDGLVAEINVHVSYAWWQSIIIYLFFGWIWY